MIRAAILLPPTPTDPLRWIPRGQLEFDAAGRVTRVGEHRAPPKGATVQDHGGWLLTPGFVDAHLHIPQIDIRGANSCDLLSWLDETVFAAEILNEDPAVARDRAERTFRELLANGVTACAAFSSSHTRATEIAFEVAEQVGIRATIGKVLMDTGAPDALLEDATSALDASAKLAKRWHGSEDGRLHFAVTPRFGPTSTPELLDGAGKLSQSAELPVQTHLSESPSECRAVADRFGARTATELYDVAGLLDTRALLAHGIHLTPSDLDTLAQRDASIVHCPESNFFLHSGRYDLARSDTCGVHTCLGSDVGAGTSFSPWEALRLASFTSKEPVPVERLYALATTDGAKALGLEEVTGALTPGDAADFALHDVGSDFDPDHIDDVTQFLSELVHGARAVHTNHTVIRGRAQ